MKLTIELVPRTAWFSNVRSEVTRSTWDHIRTTVAEKAGYRCEICGGRGSRHPVECHEIWDYNDETRTQTLKGMVALCPDCHLVKHFGRAQAVGEGGKALAHLCKVNSWTQEEALKYIRAAFVVWEERSRHQWSLDISTLSTYGIQT